MEDNRIRSFDASDIQYQLELYRTSTLGGVYTVLLDDQFTLLYGNDLYFEVHEFEPEELLGKSCFISIHPHDLEYVHHVLAEVRRNQQKYAHWEMRIITGKKQLKYMLVSGSFNQRDGAEVFDGYIVDITKQKELEDALRQSEEKFRIATQNSDIAFWTYYFDRKEIVQTTSSQNAHGYSLIMKNVPESLVEGQYIRPDNSARFLQMYEALKNGAKTACGDFWTRKKDNSGWWCERIEYTTVFDEEGKPSYAHAIGRDVTAEKLAEERYNEELSYKNAIASPNFIGSMRANLTTGQTEDITSTCDWFHQLYAEKSFDDCIFILGNLILDETQRASFISSAQSKALLEDFKNGCVQKEFCVQRKMENGIYKWISTFVKLRKKPNSSHVIAFLYSYDVDQEEVFKRAMEHIALSNYELIGCIHGMNDTYTVFSNQTNTWNSTNGNYNQAIADFLHTQGISLDANNITLETVLNALQNKPVYALEFTQTDPCGIQHSKQLFFSYIDKQTRTILFTINDFTDVINNEKKHQELLRKALNEAKKANRAKSDFLSRMSHDMRTPMNGIMGLTSLALDLPNPAPEMRAYLKGIQSSSNYLLGLINDVLDMSKIESDKLILKLQPVYFRQILDETVASVQTLANEKNISLNVHCVRTELNDVIRTDKIRLQQIFINILSNSFKFTPPGGKVDWILERLHTEENKLHSRFTIRDNGIGISKEFMPKLFEPFEQEQADITSTYMGTGLGMTIVKSLVEAMGGSIQVSSEKGVGTEIIILLDFERILSTQAGSKTTAIEEIDLTGKQILLCEDHPINMQISRQLLEKKGVIVTWARNGQESVQFFEESPLAFFDSILMDIRMPVMDGLEATKAIRSLERPDAKTIPIIAMTANAYDSDREQSKQAGMNLHLAKPVEPQALYRAIYQCIKDKEGSL